MKRSRLLSGVGAAALMASGWTGIAQAHSTATQFVPAGTAACGTSLNDDHSTYVLAGDVGPCPGDGLVITANHVALNLNGRKIFADGHGDGTGVTTSLPDYQGFRSDAGVHVDPGVIGFNIMGNSAVNCTDANRDSNVNAIVGFDAGIRVGGSPGTATEPGSIKYLHVRDNIGSLTSDFGDGISIRDSSYITVDANCIRHNGPFAGVGVYEDPYLSPYTTHHIAITNNSIVDNDINDVGFGGFDESLLDGNYHGASHDKGVRLEPGVNDNLVENNIITRSGLDGVAIFAGDAANPTTGNVVRKNTITGNGFHEYVGPTAVGCPDLGTTCAADPEAHVRNGEEVANSTPPGPRGYAQFPHRKGDGIRVLGTLERNAAGNTIGGPTSGTPGKGGSGDGNLVCGNASDGIRVDGGRKRVSAPDTWDPRWAKNIIQNNTSGGGSATCPYNDVEDAPAPNEAFDYHDSNAPGNQTAGMTDPCGSNLWGDGDPLVASSLDNKDFDGVAPDSTRNHTCIS